MLFRSFNYQVSFAFSNFAAEPLHASMAKAKREIEGIAIVIQGPIRNPQLLSISLESFKTNYPNVGIYLSTWINEENLNNIRIPSSVRVIQSDRPKVAGTGNVNFQCRSSYQGILHAEKDGFQKILKIRTDTSILSNYALERIQSLWSSSPNFEKRILTTDFNSYLFRFYHVNDQLTFCSTQVAKNYWKEFVNSESFSSIDLSRNSFPERMLLTRYLESCSFECANNIRTSLQSYRDYLIFIDWQDIGFRWFKYSERTLDYRWPQENYPHERSFVRYFDWERLQKDIEIYARDYEMLKSEIKNTN